MSKWRTVSSWVRAKTTRDLQREMRAASQVNDADIGMGGVIAKRLIERELKKREDIPVGGK